MWKGTSVDEVTDEQFADELRRNLNNEFGIVGNHHVCGNDIIVLLKIYRTKIYRINAIEENGNNYIDIGWDRQNSGIEWSIQETWSALEQMGYNFDEVDTSVDDFSSISDDQDQKNKIPDPKISNLLAALNAINIDYVRYINRGEDVGHISKIIVKPPEQFSCKELFIWDLDQIGENYRMPTMDCIINAYAGQNIFNIFLHSGIGSRRIDSNNLHSDVVRPMQLPNDIVEECMNGHWEDV